MWVLYLLLGFILGAVVSAVMLGIAGGNNDKEK